jgi:hypothetical protein
MRKFIKCSSLTIPVPVEHIIDTLVSSRIPWTSYFIISWPEARFGGRIPCTTTVHGSRRHSSDHSRAVPPPIKSPSSPSSTAHIRLSVGALKCCHCRRRPRRW